MRKTHFLIPSLIALSACLHPGAWQMDPKAGASGAGRDDGNNPARRGVDDGLLGGDVQGGRVSPDTASAEPEAESATKLTGDANDICYPPGRVDYVSAQGNYREALKLEPKNAYVLTAQATCYARQGMEEKFSESNGKATSDQRKLKRADQWFNRALSAARMALKVNQNYGGAHLVVAEVYAMTGRADKALETLDLIESQKLIVEGRESGFYAWRAYVKSSTGAPIDQDVNTAQEIGDPMVFAEYVDRLAHPRDYKDLPPMSIPVAPVDGVKMKDMSSLPSDRTQRLIGVSAGLHVTSGFNLGLAGWFDLIGPYIGLTVGASVMNGVDVDNPDYSSTGPSGTTSAKVGATLINSVIHMTVPIDINNGTVLVGGGTEIGLARYKGSVSATSHTDLNLGFGGRGAALWEVGELLKVGGQARFTYYLFKGGPVLTLEGVVAF
jgi:hypothetical protein